MEILKVKGLTKEFKSLRAVDSIDFTVEEGQIIGLLGPNGAGKSTTISMISTLLHMDKGDILYKDVDIRDKKSLIKKELGLVPQDIALYTELSGYENLVFWGNLYGLKGQKLKTRIEEVSKIIGIEERLKDKVENYSGGMKRRLNIGAALLHEPKFLIMDEPTVGIDPQSRNHILDTVLELNKTGMTIIYTSHYMEEVEYLCNHIYIMDSGKIIASGTKENLVEIVKGESKISLTLTEASNGLFEKIKGLKSVKKATSNDNIIEVISTDPHTIIKDIIEVSNGSAGEITGIDVEKPNLESVFLHLTGKALRD